MTLFEYLKNRMTAIAPNLTIMVGELVGARLISHAGSLLSLAKYPASTVQILGAEKALFRALKTKHATPKYGLIYHASVVGQAAPKHKGKISRSLASKCSLAIRVDALGDAGEDPTVGETGRLAVEARLRQLEGKQEFAISKLGRNGKSAEKTGKYEAGVKAGKDFNATADMLLEDKTRKVDSAAHVPESDSDNDSGDEGVTLPLATDANGDEMVTPKREKKEKKEKKEKSSKKDKGEKKEKSAKKEKKERSDKKEKKEKKRKAETDDGEADVESSDKKKAKKEKKSKRKSTGGDD
jgi:nucleolar protein 58